MAEKMFLENSLNKGVKVFTKYGACEDGKLLAVDSKGIAIETTAGLEYIPFTNILRIVVLARASP